MSAAGASSSSAAASQSTVFVTVGDLNTTYGFSSGVAGSAAGAVFGKAVAILVTGSVTLLHISISHGGTPLSQDYFRKIIISGSNGTKSFISSTLGSTGSFLAEGPSSTSRWIFSGTGVDTNAWDADDIGVVRTVQIFR